MYQKCFFSGAQSCRMQVLLTNKVAWETLIINHLPLEHKESCRDQIARDTQGFVTENTTSSSYTHSHNSDTSDLPLDDWFSRLRQDTLVFWSFAISLLLKITHAVVAQDCGLVELRQVIRPWWATRCSMNDIRPTMAEVSFCQFPSNSTRRSLQHKFCRSGMRNGMRFVWPDVTLSGTPSPLLSLCLLHPSSSGSNTQKSEVSHNISVCRSLTSLWTAVKWKALSAEGNRMAVTICLSTDTKVGKGEAWVCVCVCVRWLAWEEVFHARVKRKVPCCVFLCW